MAGPRKDLNHCGATTATDCDQSIDQRARQPSWQKIKPINDEVHHNLFDPAGARQAAAVLQIWCLQGAALEVTIYQHVLEGCELTATLTRLADDNLQMRDALICAALILRARLCYGWLRF